MFRASQIASEETLPALGELTIGDVTVTPSGLATASTLLRNGGDSRSTPTYGSHNNNNNSSGDTIAGILPGQHKYPVAVIFILTAKFFEAFAANGIRTILALYLRDSLYFSENVATIMLHIFNFFGQFCPIFGAIIADTYIGNVRTVSSFCFLYAFGWILLTVTSLPNIGISVVLIITSLLFIAIGNGSIRACITSLGALQFKLPEQTRQLAEYFSLYYFVYYAGIFLSKIVPPLVRAKTTCFDKAGCYPAVFGTLGVAFMASWLTFALGKFFYKPEKITEENILVKFYGCIKYALLVKWRRTEKQPAAAAYWLHNAIGRYDERFVNDVAKVLKISKLFIPLPIYFALLAQQDSSWTFQASMMNTTIGNGTLTLQPDQAKAMGPVLLFILIPLWQYVCTPLLRGLFRCELKPLVSVTVGGVCSALAFVCAGVLQEYIYNAPYKSVNILWQIPQFLLIMLGELLLSIPGLKFAFTQAPASMKSVVTAAWFLNNAFGNLLVVVITQINGFSSQSTEYFFYAVFMLVSIIMFSLLAYDYSLHERTGRFYVEVDRLTMPLLKAAASNSAVSASESCSLLVDVPNVAADRAGTSSRAATDNPDMLS